MLRSLMSTLGQIIERNDRFSPERPALVCGETRLTHAEFARRTRRLAAGLYARGLRRHDRYSVLAMNCAEYFDAYGAAECAGFIINTVNWRLAPAEMEWVLRDAAPRLLMFEAQYANTVSMLRERLPSVEHYVCIARGVELVPDWAEPYEAVVESGDDAGPPIRSRSEDLFCLMYTSGTTGKPKGVLHTHHSAARIAEVLSSELKLDGDCRLLAIAPLFHMGARTLSWGACFRGGCTILHRSFDAEEVIRTIERERITAIHLVPTMVQALLDAPNISRHDLSSLKMLMYAAAPMPVPVLRRAVEAFGPITYNGYGQTEINLISLLRPYQHHLDGTPAQIKQLGSVGQAHLQSEIRIVSNDGTDCPAGEIGEVVARSETAMAGYWNNSAATLETLRDGWVHTGDVGYLDDEGYLFLVDRKKDMIISGGENVYSREVEEAIVLHPAVHEAAVIGVPDRKWGEAVRAIVVLKPHEQVTSEELIAFCKTRIAAYKCPKFVAFAVELPRLNTGKVNKAVLRVQFGTG